MSAKESPLEKIEVASPCHASWEEMAGNEQVRFCSHCNLNVYNLSAMSRRQAEELVQEKEGRLCVRFYRRTDGTMLTENCPVGWRKARQRLKLVAGGIASGLAMALGLPALFRPAVVMGELGPVPPQTPPPGLINLDPPPTATMGKPEVTMGQVASIRTPEPRPPAPRKPARPRRNGPGRWTMGR